jgi:AraC family transcriptional regulator of adaptative response/methylated-DNA-[protein]-cysteine methyltransferase
MISEFFMPQLPSPPEMQQAYQQSDASFDGIFYVGVRTTGIFCRPSCSARKPLPRNVEYYATPREALFAGFRPCKRCKPLETIGHPPLWLGGVLAAIEADPSRRISDGTLRSMKIDPARVRRHFKKAYGMTFQAYCRGRRLQNAFVAIRRGATVDDATFSSGFESHSGFRDAFARTFGVSPGSADGTDCITVDWIESPLGPLIAGATQEALVLLEFSDRRMIEAQIATLRRLFKKPFVPGTTPLLHQTRNELHEYFAGSRREFEVPIDFPASEFQQKVWNALLKIPYGQTLSYEGLANKVGTPNGQRAVGHANGLNRLAIIVPCHRVVNKNGELGGYGGGLWRKQALLDLERGERQFEFAPAKKVETGKRESGKSEEING